MTQAELFAQWQRYMHRADLSADLDTTLIYAQSMIRNRLMRKDDPLFPDAEVSAILVNNPQLYLHAGLSYLAELAMDDTMVQREMSLFNDDMAAYQMQYSINQGPAMMVLYGGFDAP